MIGLIADDFEMIGFAAYHTSQRDGTSINWIGRIASHHAAFDGLRQNLRYLQSTRDNNVLVACTSCLDDLCNVEWELRVTIRTCDRGFIMQCGWCKEIQVKSMACHEVRALLNSRAQLVKVKRDLENQIRGLLKNHGLIIGKAGGNVFHRRIEELLDRHGLLWEAVRSLLEVREKVGREIAALYRKLLDLDETTRTADAP